VRHAAVTSGRTYARGLTKFEPTEMERLLVPDLSELNERESSTELEYALFPRCKSVSRSTL
jgi:hypothetical protein